MIRPLTKVNESDLIQRNLCDMCNSSNTTNETSESLGGNKMSVFHMDDFHAEASLRESKSRTDGKWSTRRTVAFVVLVCSAFWVALGFAAFKLFF